MGLSGRKNKQRIPNDPRNLSWADDAARFGSSYLSKFGWDASKGLGVGGDGRTSHVKVSQKLDMMGIGAAHRNDPDGIAWKQNKDFESVLKRLNEANGDGGEIEEEKSGSVVDGFVKGKEEEEEEEEEKRKEKKEKKKKEKREKRDAGEKRKRGEDGEGRGKKPRKDDETAASTEEKRARVVPRHRSHRARHIAAKSLACKSAAAISEILGIAPSEAPKGTLAAADDVEQIRTSTKSLEEYFRGKMGKAPVAAREDDGVPRAGLGFRVGE